jgi:hypothetical protein
VGERTGSKMLQKLILFLKSALWLKCLCLISVVYDLIVGLLLINECTYQLNPILFSMVLSMQLFAFVHAFDASFIVDYLPEISLESKLILVPFFIFMSVVYYPSCFAVHREGGHLTKYGQCVPKSISNREIQAILST